VAHIESEAERARGDRSLLLRLGRLDLLATDYMLLILMEWASTFLSIFHVDYYA
jgi:hypothetical protein